MDYQNNPVSETDLLSAVVEFTLDPDTKYEFRLTAYFFILFKCK